MHDVLSSLHLAVMVSLAALLACDANLGSVAVAESGTAGDETTGEGGEPVACIGGELCPMGTSCSNGLCATDCDSAGDCEDDEHCGLDGVCHSNVIPSCGTDSDCAPTQSCINQVCTVTGSSCDLEDYLQDGCPSNAVCIEDFEQPGQAACHELPACAGDQTCPIGLDGSVCNTGQLPTKDEICLDGLCDVVENCPDLWSCVRYDNAVLGFCSDGGFASPCSVDMHCLSGNCVPLPGLGGGVCG
jgi:hypothetical protein